MPDAAPPPTRRLGSARSPWRAVAADLGGDIDRFAPKAGALLTALAGVVAMSVAVTPRPSIGALVLDALAPGLARIVGHGLLGAAGLMLVVLAFGLRSRLRSAWRATLAVAATSLALVAVAGERGPALAALGALLLVLAPQGRIFRRRTDFSVLETTPRVMALVLAAVLAAGAWGLALRSGHRPPLQDAGSGDGAVLGGWIAAAATLAGLGIWRRLTADAAGQAPAGDLSRARAVLAGGAAHEPNAVLALLGDKRFLFSPSGRSFLMYAVRGHSWVALGAPVGAPEERLDLMRRFLAAADVRAARAGFYGVSAADLPDLVELDLAIQKIGETAIIPLASFSIEGRKRGNMRRAWRKLSGEGLVFEVLAPGAVEGVMDALKDVSDRWLETHAGGDKRFSMGGFVPAYLRECAVAVVHHQGRLVAFASLWLTADRGAFSTDLMRYAPDAPKNVMDFLFVELMAWGQAQGYGVFDFGMAPLAGLHARPLAPLVTKVGDLLFHRAERVYNFKGLYHYKDKFDPAWRGRYVASPSRWSLPIVLLDAALLSSGGVRALAKRPKADA